jgi:hypothetical protein
MSAATVVTRGYGSFGDVNFLPTRGYGNYGDLDSPVTPSVDLTDIPANRTIYVTERSAYLGTGS